MQRRWKKRQRFSTPQWKLKGVKPGLAGQIQPRHWVLLGPESTGRTLHPAHEQRGDGHSQCTVVESYYDRTEVCDVPASLDKQARAVPASAYYFQYHWWGMHAAFCPMRNWTSRLGFQLPRGGRRVLHKVLGVRQLSAHGLLRCLGGRYAEHGPRTLCRGRKRHHPDTGR